MFEIKKQEFVNKTFRLEKNLVENLGVFASKNNISMNELVSQCCKYALSNMEKSKNEDLR